jgi:hypothetical protein
MWVGSEVAPYYTRPNSADKITNTYQNRLYLIKWSGKSTELKAQADQLIFVRIRRTG